MLVGIVLGALIHRSLELHPGKANDFRFGLALALINASGALVLLTATHAITPSFRCAVS